MIHCAGPGCTNPQTHGKLCEAHYRQQLRGKPLRALRGRKPLTQVSFRCPLELRQKAERAAVASGMTFSEWWIAAALARLR